METIAERLSQVGKEFLFSGSAAAMKAENAHQMPEKPIEGRFIGSYPDLSGISLRAIKPFVAYISRRDLTPLVVIKPFVAYISRRDLTPLVVIIAGLIARSLRLLVVVAV